MSPDSRLKRLALGTASIFLLIVGTLLGVPQMYVMAVAISLVPLVFWLIGYLLLKGVTCNRKMPATCQRGDRVKVELILTNTGVFPRFYIRAFDRLPRWVKFEGYDGAFGTILLNLRQNEQAKLTYYMQPLRRGLQKIGPTKLSFPDLIGLSSYATTVSGIDELLVYPEVVPVNAKFLSSGASRGWMDQENAATRGIGSDFQGVREYRTGDDLRRVNWKTTARTGSLAVTEYALGYVNDVAIALDLSPESYGQDDSTFNSAFETAVEVAASLAVAGLKNGSSVLLITNGDLPTIKGPIRGGEGILPTLAALALVVQNKDETFVDVINRFGKSKEHDRSLIVITGDSESSKAVDETLSGVRRSSSGMLPLKFQIESQSFKSAGPYNFYSSSEGRHAAPDVFESPSCKNIVIRPDTDLRELFSRVSV